MMESACLLVKVICVLAAVLELAAAQLRMDVDYPDGPRQNRVRLTCRSGLKPIFFKDRVPITQGQSSNQVTSLIDEGDQVTITFTQAQEGFFRCVGDDEISPAIGLAGNDSVLVCRPIRYVYFFALHSVQLHQTMSTYRQ